MKRLFGLTLLLVFIIALSGYGGYRLSSKRTSTKINGLEKQINDLQNTMPKPAPKQTDKTSSYAVIVPFAVRFPYSDKPAGLGYTDTTADEVAFDSETLSDFANKIDSKNTCGLDATPGPLGFLKRTTDLPLVKADHDRDGLVGQVGSYYYVYSHPKPCSTNTTVINEQSLEVNALVDDLSHLEKTSS